jgi:hypothetical protein
MERSGAETEIKAGLLQYGFFKWRNNDCECPVGNGLPKEGGEATIGLYGKQRVGAQFQQSTSRRSCPGTNLECNSIGRETTPLA